MFPKETSTTVISGKFVTVERTIHSSSLGYDKRMHRYCCASFGLAKLESSGFAIIILAFPVSVI